MKHFTLSPSHTVSQLWQPAACLMLALVPMGAVQAQQVYRCPGNLYTDSLSAREASAKGCKTLDGAPITVIQSSPPRGANANRNTGAASASSSPENKVAADEQKARDTDARRILEAELRKEEAALEALKAEYNNGQPPRHGNEQNYQKYLDRVNEMKEALTRKEADVASLRRELSKFGGAK